MKKLLLLLLIPFLSFGQIGFKAGLNHSTTSANSDEFNSNFNPGIICGFIYRAHAEEKNRAFRAELLFHQFGYSRGVSTFLGELSSDLTMGYISISSNVEFFIKDKFSFLLGLGHNTPVYKKLINKIGDAELTVDEKVDKSDSALLNGRLGLAYNVNETLLLEFTFCKTIMTGFPSGFNPITKGPQIFQFGVAYFI